MPIQLTRRRFLGGAAGLVAAAALGDGFFVEPTAIEVTRHDLLIPGLAPRLAGLRIACITDVHLDGHVHAPARAVLALLARERPEIVVLIGDIYNTNHAMEDLVSWAGEARGTLATFATFGNWEHVAGIDRESAERYYGRVGVEFLYNSSARVRVGTAALTVVGIDDPVAGEPDVAAALRGSAGTDPTIWVLHGPGFVDGVPHGRFPQPAAILTGHTHGGQVRLPFYTPYTPTGSGRFVAGWYRDTLAPLYVSRGIGTVALPLRFCCPPELPIFTARPA